MAEPESGLMERGFYSLYACDGEGVDDMMMILSPEGDTHRLIGLCRDGGRMRGQVRQVAGRLGAIIAALPPAHRPVALGRYRLGCLGSVSRLHFDGDDDGGDILAAPLTREQGWSLRVGPPAELAQRRHLPAELRARLRAQEEVAPDRPHPLDYVGVRLTLAPIGMVVTSRPLPLPRAAPLRGR
jgi:hypothetical protein